MAERKLGRGLDALLGVGAATDAEQLVELGIEELRSGPHQPREEFNEARLKELASSIRESGLLQPVLVRPAAGGYEIVAGERRVRAARIAGRTTVPAIVRDYSDEQMMVLSLVENVQRDDLNAIEKARAYKRLQQILGGTQEDVAGRVGIDPSSVSNMIRLLDLSQPLQELVRKSALSMGHARALLGLESDDARLALARRIIKEGLSVRAAEPAVEIGQQQLRRLHEKPYVLEGIIRQRFGERPLQPIGARVVLGNFHTHQLGQQRTQADLVAEAISGGRSTIGIEVRNSGLIGVADARRDGVAVGL